VADRPRVHRYAGALPIPPRAKRRQSLDRGRGAVSGRRRGARRTGLLAAPVAIVIVLGGIYAHFGQLSAVQQGFAGLAATASGLVLSMALRIAAPLWRTPVGVAVAAITFTSVTVLRLPLLLTMLVLAPVSILLSALTRP
jgi:chromate transport protein ChrA